MYMPLNPVWMLLHAARSNAQLRKRVDICHIACANRGNMDTVCHCKAAQTAATHHGTLAEELKAQGILASVNSSPLRLQNSKISSCTNTDTCIHRHFPHKGTNASGAHIPAASPCRLPADGPQWGAGCCHIALHHPGSQLCSITSTSHVSIQAQHT